MYIQSSKNARVKQWKKLDQRKEREKTQSYLIEGFHLVEEAIKSKADILEFLIQEDIDTPLLEEVDISKHRFLSEEAAKAIQQTETSQGIFAVIKMPTEKPITQVSAPYLFLDHVQDPGNVGTMIRTADAAGFEGVILGEGCADVYNDKTLRSAQGSHFHLAVFQEDLENMIHSFKKMNLPVYGTALDPKANSYQEVDPTGPFALIMGNEGQGMSDTLLSQTTANLYIPLKGQAESLNVGVAAGILMFSLWKN